MSKGPILRINALLCVEYPKAGIEKIIICIEQNIDGLAFVPRNEVEMVVSWQFVDLEDAPNRVIQCYDR